jgi:hypothetical protein
VATVAGADRGQAAAHPLQPCGRSELATAAHPLAGSKNSKIWQGPLGPYYSSGLLAADHFLFATQQLDWNWGGNGPFTGLRGIAYSTDHGAHWVTPGKGFPASLGNLSWVIRGRGGFFPDGYAHAIAAAIPIVSWPGHLTYPQMAYDPPLHRYLLTFSCSYATAPPAIWRNGSELLILEAPPPWGPFSFVAHEPEFGPSNGYGAGFPIKWISSSGRDLWLKWAANFDGCRPHLDCSGAYGFDYRRMHLTVAG